MRTSGFSFISEACKLTVALAHMRNPFILSEVISRVVATALLSLSAVFDLVYHGLLLLPTFIYDIGKSIFTCRMDLSLPWEHLQRIRNVISPLLLGSVFGLIHPYAGVAMSEPTEKHIVLGMLSSNSGKWLDTPCSPIHTFSLVEDLAAHHRYAKDENGADVEIFTQEHIQLIGDAKKTEKSLESLSAQEFVHKITNLTLGVMVVITKSIEDSDLSNFFKGFLIRLSGILIPLLTIIDCVTALILQFVFLITGAIRWICGRGPIYTEVTSNPLMHIMFLIQNTLKVVGNLIGTLVWFFSPLAGFQVSLAPCHFFFKMQRDMVMFDIQAQMNRLKGKMVVPIVMYEDGICETFSLPIQTMHKTYLIVEKEKAAFNLYWVNRPCVSHKKGMTKEAALVQIDHMLKERFPFMDMNKLMRYPVVSKKPNFTDADQFIKIESQGGISNCVISNLFGMFATVDKLDKKKDSVSNLRYQTVRAALSRDYAFYTNDFLLAEDETWESVQAPPDAPI